MARVVCQVLFRPNRITFLWSDGTASFEPYHQTGANREEFHALARAVSERLRALAGAEPDPPAVLELAEAGHAFFRHLFRADSAEAAAREVEDWFAALSGQGAVERLDILSDSVEPLPWRAVFDQPPDSDAFEDDLPQAARGFWGARYQLTTDRRVNPLARRPVLERPVVLLVVDPAARTALPSEQQDRLSEFAQANALPVVESARDLADSIKADRPDVLYLFCRARGDSILLGDEAVTGTDLGEWLRTEAGRLDAFVFLNACQVGASDPRSDPLAVLEGLAPRAFVAPPTPLPAELADRFGRDFLAGFVGKGEPLAQALQQARAALAPLSLVYSASGPAGLRLVTKEAEPAGADETGPEPLPLPVFPYFPLTPYDGADSPLFVGRDGDSEAVAELLDESGVGLVLLHGQAAAGKGSLLRAGLLPILEEECVGYRALRDRTETEEGWTEIDYPTLTIRATSDLQGQVALALCDYCARPVSHVTPTGRTVEVDLPSLLYTALKSRPAAEPAPQTAIQADGPAPGTGSAVRAGPPALPQSGEVNPEDLRLALRQDARLLARIVAAISERLPHDLVLVIEQGEELFTLRRYEGGAPARRRGLAMLRHLAQEATGARVVLSLRTEYQGRLLTHLLQGAEAAPWLRTYLLEPLREEDLIEAVLLPTATEPLPGTTQVPFEKYRFRFEAGVPQQIVRQARGIAAAQGQSAATLVQAVCALLFDLARTRTERVIRAADLKRIGGVEQALGRYVGARLKELPLDSVNRRGLRSLLEQMYVPHADGTVTRDLVAEEEILKPRRALVPVESSGAGGRTRYELIRGAKDWFGRGDRVPEEVIDLAADARLLEVNYLNLGGRQGRYISLAHDALAGVGSQWVEEGRRAAQGRTRIVDTLWIMIPLLILALVFAWRQWRGLAAANEQLEGAQNLLKKAAVRDADAVQSRWLLYTGQISMAQDALRAGDRLRARQHLQMARPRHDDKRMGLEDRDERGFEWYYLWGQLHPERRTLYGHEGPVASVAVGPEGKALATGDHSGTIRLWDGETGRIRAPLAGHKGTVHALAFAPDGKLLASARADGMIHLWDGNLGRNKYTEGGKPRESLPGHKGPVRALAFAPDGKTLASADADGKVVLWDITTKGKAKTRATLEEHKGTVHSLAYAPDGKTLASAGADQTVRLWDVSAEGKEKQREVLKGHGGPVQAVAFAPDGKALASAAQEKRDGFEYASVRLWDPVKGKELAPLEPGLTGIFALAFVDATTLATAGQDDSVRLWDTSTGKLKHELKSHLGWVASLAVTSDGKALLSGSHDGTARLWDLGERSPPDVLRGHKGWVNAVAFAPDSTRLASAGADGVVKLWDMADGAEKKVLKGHQGAVLALAFAPDGKTLASAGADRTVRLWDIDADSKDFGSEKKLLKGHEAPVTCLAFTPSKLLVSGSSDGMIWTWSADPAAKDFGKGDSLRVTGGVRGITPLGGSPFIAVATDTQGLAIVHLKERRQVGQRLEGHTAEIQGVAYWPGTGSVITAGADRTLRVWDVEKKVEEGVLRGHTGGVSSVAIASGAPTLLVSGGWDGLVKLWNPRREAERFSLTGHTGPVQAVAIAPDRRTIASAGRDGTVRLWRAGVDPAPAPQEHPRAEEE
ncbi:MAG: hypothetical protein L0Z62_47970 [Gemmataceae bacterium]|nr:hypothetical protein [Gemmataceae bacterium]